MKKKSKSNSLAQQTFEEMDKALDKMMRGDLMSERELRQAQHGLNSAKTLQSDTGRWSIKQTKQYLRNNARFGNKALIVKDKSGADSYGFKFGIYECVRDKHAHAWVSEDFVYNRPPLLHSLATPHTNGWHETFSAQEVRTLVGLFQMNNEEGNEDE